MNDKNESCPNCGGDPSIASGAEAVGTKGCICGSVALPIVAIDLLVHTGQCKVVESTSQYPMTKGGAFGIEMETDLSREMDAAKSLGECPSCRAYRAEIEALKSRVENLKLLAATTVHWMMPKERFDMAIRILKDIASVPNDPMTRRPHTYKEFQELQEKCSEMLEANEARAVERAKEEVGHG